MIFIKGLFWIVFIISLAIFIHELGHFVSAKLSKVKVEEFALGYGKILLSKKFGETLYRINLFPFGGYVRLLGEEGKSNDPRSFSKKSLAKRFLILVSGVAMNFLLAVFTFYIILSFKNFEILLPRYTDHNFIGSKVEIYNKPLVAEIIENTPAEEVNFPTNSIIWSIDGVEVKNSKQFQDYLRENEGKEIVIKCLVLGQEWWRSGEWEEISVVPSSSAEEEGVLLGVRFAEGVASYYHLDYSGSKLFSGFLHSVNFTGYNLDVMKELVLLSFEERSVKPVSEGVSGVVGLANTTYDLVKVGDTFDILNLLGVVNISLAIVNFLPIPGLDGGYVLFMLFERIKGKKIADKYQEWATRFGLIFMIILGILITIKDIIQFNIIGRAIEFIRNLF